MQELRIPDLDLLESDLAYKFHNRALLERAITHRSWAHEQVAPGDEDLARNCTTRHWSFSVTPCSDWWSRTIFAPRIRM